MMRRKRITRALERINEENIKVDSSGKGFLDKVFDFFNYKPIEDFNTPKIRKKKDLRIKKKLNTLSITENGIQSH